MTERFQFLSQLDVIVDFAVVRDPITLVYRAHRLVPGRTDIDYGQAAVAECEECTVYCVMACLGQGRKTQPGLPYMRRRIGATAHHRLRAIALKKHRTFTIGATMANSVQCGGNKGFADGKAGRDERDDSAHYAASYFSFVKLATYLGSCHFLA